MSKFPPRTPRGAWLDTSCEGRGLCDVVVSHLTAGTNVGDAEMEGVIEKEKEKEKEAMLKESCQSSQRLRHTMVKPVGTQCQSPQPRCWERRSDSILLGVSVVRCLQPESSKSRTMGELWHTLLRS